MNKETRQFIWGLILFVIGGLLLTDAYYDLKHQFKSHGDLSDTAIRVLINIVRLIVGGWFSYKGINLIEKTI